MADEITLTLPREPDFQRVAHLVLGGLAVRMNLTVESLEDLQTALDALLAPDLDGTADTVTVRMCIRADALETVVGPLRRGLLDEIERDADDGLGVRRVLDSTVDDVHVDGDCVRLTKRVSSG